MIMVNLVDMIGWSGKYDVSGGSGESGDSVDLVMLVKLVNLLNLLVPVTLVIPVS